MVTGIADLLCGAIGAQPVPRDWSDWPEGGWQFWQAVECDAGHVTVGSGAVECHECGEELLADGPAMNSAWRCDVTSPEEAARALDGLPLCVVRDDAGPTWLALTGGGMDLSWEIAAAYMRLGYLPPAALADLPEMAGRPRGEEDQRVVAASLRSMEEAAHEAVRQLRLVQRRVHAMVVRARTDRLATDLTGM